MAGRNGIWNLAVLGALLALVGLGAGLSAFQAQAAGKGPQGASLGIPLRDTEGRERTLKQLAGGRVAVVVFTGTACPISNSYVETLSRLEQKYRERGARFVAVNANPGEDLAAVAKHAREFPFSFPVLKDENQALANALGARVTPEAFVLDRKGAVRYRGRVDDAYASRTERRSDPTGRDLDEAVAAVLAGKAVKKASLPAIGCAIVRPQAASADSATKVTYYRDVAPILAAHCQSCHRPGQVGPFALMTYTDARSWGPEIKRFTASRRMPPWKPVPGHGEFLDERRLASAQIATLAAWADAGMPEGDPRDAPTPREWPEGWALGEPDLVLTMPEEYEVEASGRDVYRCFVLPSGVTEDRWVTAVEVRPGNSRIVHHVINFLDTTGQGRKLDEKDPGPGYTSFGGPGFIPVGGLAGWVPGNTPRFLPEGIGMRLPKNADVIMQVHYHKSGKPEKDRTRIGIHFARSAVRQQLRAYWIVNLGINLPAGESRYRATASLTAGDDVTALSVTPHMHLLGREMKVTATLPDGTRLPMVWVKPWEFKWQDTYVYQKPLKLPKGTRIELEALYDNSDRNPNNPNRPPKPVRWGEETTDEMCLAVVGYTVDAEDLTSRR